ncbi:hypothetical protein F9C07_1000245 [Aspergillus flavus]|uniref:Uncharacterized protein n=1 Tax=Aspergillus flavus (strain ATCC 200026 / FGSC A1120 / IAM 13836 / NRRL 3357 / JCM 12722 / SRRC 167) TaxID=332952 RepID=A0A7U2MNQ4_ASPFN|nr:hypothetical protein F9C07_1000245 [Aspergillus flavus]
MADQAIASDLAPGSEIKQELDNVEFEPLDKYVDSILRNAQVKFRDHAEEVPEGVPGLIYGDSESDEEPVMARGPMAKTALSAVAGPGSLRETTIGGAVVKNLTLLVPKDATGGYGDLPVLPITGVGQEKAELVAVVGKDPEEGAAPNIPILLLPDEEDDEGESQRASASATLSQLAAASVLVNLGKTAAKRRTQAPVKEEPKAKPSDGKASGKEETKDEETGEEETKEEEGKGEEGKVAKSELNSYVLSGDIEKLFGIKGLTGKLYKFKGPETKEDKKKSETKKEGKKEDTEEGEDQSNENDEEEAGPKARDAGKDPLKAQADSNDSAPKEEKAGKEDEAGSKGDKKDKEEKKDKGKKEPAREKVKINPKSLKLLGKPLGKILPFLESEELKSLPIENLEFTYCEEESGHFFPPGLRLEVDVPLSGSLQWATDALQKMFGEKRTPKKIHLSADLGKTRDWSKRPKVEDFALRGYFDGFGNQEWDILKFKTLGLELTATKAASKKPKDNDKGKDGKETKKKNDKGDDESEEQEQQSRDATEGSPTDEPKTTKDDKPGSEVTIRQVSSAQAEASATDSQQDDADVEHEEGDSSKKGEEKKSPSKADEKDDKKDGKDKKDKVKKSYNYGFGFFGTVSFIKIPHANSPLDLHIRIGRDFEVEKEKKDEKKEEKKGKKKEEEGKEKKKEIKEDEGEEKNEGKENDSEKKVEALEKKDEPSSDTNKASKDTVELAKDGEMSSEKSTEAGDKPKKAEGKKHSDGKHKRIWKLAIYCDEWKDIYGVKNVSLKKAELKSSFEQGDFKKTLEFNLSADIKLGGGSFKVKGKISKADSFLDAELGDVSLSDFKKIQAQMQGQHVPEEKKKEEKEKTAEEIKKEAEKKDEEKKDEKEEAQGHELIFKKIHVRISRQTIEKEQTWKGSLLFDGHVTFNGKSSARARLELTRDGLTISGGLADYQIPDTKVTIEQAQMKIYIGFKRSKKDKKIEESKTNDNKSITDASSEKGKSGQPDQDETTAVVKAGVDSKPEKSDTKNVEKPGENEKKTKRESEFAILGVVKIHEVPVSVGFYMARKNDKEKRDWLAFGSVGNFTLSQLVPDLKGTDFDLQLDNIALIASSEDREVTEEEEDKKDDKKDEKKDEKKEDTEKKKKEDKTEEGTKIELEKIFDIDDAYSKIMDKKKEGKKEDKKKDKKEDKKEKKDDKKKEKKEADDDDAHAGVLKKVESYKYPIRKGVQVCATIRKFDTLDLLNNNKPMDGLVLIIAFTPNGLEITINLPKTLQVRVRPDVILGDFGASILPAKGELELSATLTLLFDDQRPIRVTGTITGSATEAKAAIYMNPNDKWINPFQLNEKVVVSKLGLGAGITYATVCAMGPDELSLTGSVAVGSTLTADLVLSLGVKKEQVIYFHISELNISKLVKLAGEMTDIAALQSVNGGEDFLVFRDITFYMSTGAKVHGVYYDRGIHVKGMVELFGKKGDFDGQIRDDGVVINGGVDNFNIGGLEVRAARAGQERATMGIELTGDRQKVLIDGMIRFHALELSIFIDADVQERRLDADITLKFTESIMLHLKANARVPDSKSLEGVVMNFEAEIRPDVLGAIFDAINQTIGDIGKLATETIENAERKLQEQMEEKQSELEKMANELKAMKEKVDEEVRKREAKIDQDNLERKRLEDELEKLEKAVTDAEAEKDQNKTKLNKLKNQKAAKELEFDKKIREKEREYERKEKEERDRQEEWKAKRRQLENQKEASFGDALRSKEAADADWASWVAQEDHLWREIQKSEKNAADAWAKGFWYWGETTKWNIIANKQKAELEWVHAQKAIATEARHVGEAIFCNPLWIEIEKELNKAGEEIQKHADALAYFVNGEHYKALEALTRDKKRELDRQIASIQKLEEESKKIETKLKLARQELKKNKGRITEKETKLQKEVERLQGELKTRPFEDAYKAKLQDHESIAAQIQWIQKKLDEIKTGIDQATQAAQESIRVLKQAIPAVERIVVTASTDVFVKRKPLTFKIEARWMGKLIHAEVQWAPGQDVNALYEQIGLKVIKAADEKA